MSLQTRRRVWQLAIPMANFTLHSPKVDLDLHKHEGLLIRIEGGNQQGRKTEQRLTIFRSSARVSNPINNEYEENAMLDMESQACTYYDVASDDRSQRSAPARDGIIVTFGTT